MISRKSAISIAEIYTKMFSHQSYYQTAFGGRSIKENVNNNYFYDFLYENEYEALFCNMVKTIQTTRELKEWLLKIHTGESFYNITINWSWEKRKELGQSYLKNLARDYILYFQTLDASYISEEDKKLYDEMIRRLEIDGYIFYDGELRETEEEVLDVEAEMGYLESLHNKLKLPDRQQTFNFLKLTEDHYVAGRWSDSIGNARKFFEAIFQQVANRHSEKTKGIKLTASIIDKPVLIRQYLETESLLEKKEREAIDKIYGLLSHTGSHPYMAEKDQARLLRQICLVTTEFILLRLVGALKE